MADGLRGTSRRSRWLVLGCMVAIVLGIWLRFDNLGRSVYWYDETITSLRIAGLTKEAVRSPGPEVLGRLWSPSAFTDYFFELTPERGWDHTLSSLAYENPEQVPIYYLLARAWAMVFGNSPGAVRSLSALFGVVLLPAMYALVGELGTWGRSLPSVLPSGLPLGAARTKIPWRMMQWTTTAIVALSPMQILYAREARGYSLSLCLTVLSTVILLKALRATQSGRGDRRLWICYALSLTVGLYTQLPFLLVMVTHGLFIGFGRSARRWSQSLANYGLACLATLIAFSPWLYFVLTYRQRIGWLNRDLSFGTLLQRWLFNLSATLFDAQAGFSYRPLFDITATNSDSVRLFEEPLMALIVLYLVCLIVSCIIWMVRSQPRSLWLLPMLWTGIPIPFALLDLINGGQRSTIPRYFVVSYLGLAIILGWAIATLWLQVRHASRWQQWGYGFILIGLTLLPLSSAYSAAQLETWWNKYTSYDVPAIAHTLTESPPPADPTRSTPAPQVLLTSANPLRLLSLTPRLPDNFVLHIVTPDAPVPEPLPTLPQAYAYYPPELWLPQTTSPNASPPIRPTDFPQLWQYEPSPAVD